MVVLFHEFAGSIREMLVGERRPGTGGDVWFPSATAWARKRRLAIEHPHTRTEGRAGKFPRQRV